MMIWQHLQTFLWLRWRLGANRSRRAGMLSFLIEKFILFMAAGAALIAFLVGMLLGAFALPRASTIAFMLIWDGIVAGFLFFWMTELLADLQRSEVLSLENFLHLPVPLSGVFLINYLGSIVSLASILFLPLMAGLSVGLVFSKGSMMLWLFPLLAAFTLMVTAITYQFRGWLASIMVNQRRRRSIIAIASVTFMLLVQLPQIVNIVRFRQTNPGSESAMEQRKQRDELERQKAAREITQEEYAKRRAELRQGNNLVWNTIRDSARTANLVVPLGWLPYGATASTEGNSVPPLLATIGLALIGAASLRRSYGTTLKLYTGHFTAKNRPAAKALPAPAHGRAAAAASSSSLLERQLPWISEHASAVALATFRSLMRAPEAKMILLSPIVMVGIAAMMVLNRSSVPAEFVRPLMAAGARTIVLFMLIGLAGNVFGFDRAGFRAFVLASASRKDILLGKNVSLSPFAIVLMTIPVIVLQAVYPMRIDHFLAALLQMIPMYLVYCLVTNFISMLAPTAMKSGSLSSSGPKGLKILIHLGFISVLPIVQALTMIPLGIEFLLNWSRLAPWFPAYLVLTVAEIPLVLYAYLQVLEWQGSLLQKREQRILEVVTSKPE